MTDGEQEDVWSIPAFHFAVDISGVGNNLKFQEVSGLDFETQAIEYRSGNSKVFSVQKMPETKKFYSVTLTKGVFPNDDKFWDWFGQIESNTTGRVTITIRLLDNYGDPNLSWYLKNAWPTKISGVDSNAENEIAIEALDLTCERIEVRNG